MKASLNKARVYNSNHSEWFYINSIPNDLRNVILYTYIFPLCGKVQRKKMKWNQILSRYLKGPKIKIVKKKKEKKM